MRLPTYLLIVLFLIPIYGLKAQDGFEQRTLLKDGTLIVRLQSNKNKLQKLEEKLASTSLSKKERNRYFDLLKDTRNQTTDDARRLITAFKKEYNFSNVLFMWDKDTEQVLNKSFDDLFLDSELKPMTNTPDVQEFMLASVRKTSPTDNVRTDAIIIYTSKLKEPSASFPGITPINSAKLLLSLFLDGEKAHQKSLNKAVKKLNKALWGQ